MVWADFVPLWTDFNYLMIPAAILLTAFFTGLALNKIIYGYLGEVSFNSSYKELIIRSLRGIPVSWSLMAGIYVAVNMTVLKPNILDLMQKAMLVVVLLSATVVLSRLASGIVTINAQKTEGILESTSLLINIVEFGIYAVGVLVILQSLGISITPILTALGVGGLAVALALQDTLANLIAGIHILLAKRIKPGDYVKLSSGEEGHITDINWRDTTLNNANNHLVIVPNSKISSAIVTNFALPSKEMSVTVDVGVDYDNDLFHVEKIATEVASKVMRECKGGVANAVPLIRFNSFDESNVGFRVILRCEEITLSPLVKHEFIKQIHKRFDEEGIKISYPVRILRQEETK